MSVKFKPSPPLVALVRNDPSGSALSRSPKVPSAHRLNVLKRQVAVSLAKSRLPTDQMLVRIGEAVDQDVDMKDWETL